jgi:hypothetical protein
MSNPNTDNFANNYRILKDGVDKLRAVDIQDIDHLVELVSEITLAHRACRDRIQSIKAMLALQTDQASNTTE